MFAGVDAVPGKEPLLINQRVLVENNSFIGAFSRFVAILYDFVHRRNESGQNEQSSTKGGGGGPSKHEIVHGSRRMQSIQLLIVMPTIAVVGDPLNFSQTRRTH